MRRSIQALVVALLLAAGCGHTKPPPGTALRDVKFAESPHLVSRDGRYYLRYRVAFVGGLQLMMLLIGKKTPDKGYYYFSGPLSHPEHGETIERDLDRDELAPLAQRNAIYWLDPDGTETHLTVRR